MAVVDSGRRTSEGAIIWKAAPKKKSSRSSSRSNSKSNQKSTRQILAERQRRERLGFAGRRREDTIKALPTAKASTTTAFGGPSKDATQAQINEAIRTGQDVFLSGRRISAKDLVESKPAPPTPKPTTAKEFQESLFERQRALAEQKKQEIVVDVPKPVAKDIIGTIRGLSKEYQTPENIRILAEASIAQREAAKAKPTEKEKPLTFKEKVVSRITEEIAKSKVIPKAKEEIAKSKAISKAKELYGIAEKKVTKVTKKILPEWTEETTKRMEESSVGIFGGPGKPLALEGIEKLRESKLGKESKVVGKLSEFIGGGEKLRKELRQEEIGITKGIYTDIRKKPVKTLAEISLFAAGGAAFKAVGAGAKALGKTPDVIFKIGGLGLAGVYTGSKVGEFATAESGMARGAVLYETGKELTGFAIGAKAVSPLFKTKPVLIGEGIKPKGLPKALPQLKKDITLKSISKPTFLGKPPKTSDVVRILKSEGEFVGRIGKESRITAMKRRFDVVIGERPAKVEVVGVKRSIVSELVKEGGELTKSAFILRISEGGKITTARYMGVGMETGRTKIKGFDIFGVFSLDFIISFNTGSGI